MTEISVPLSRLSPENQKQILSERIEKEIDNIDDLGPTYTGEYTRTELFDLHGSLIVSHNNPKTVELRGGAEKYAAR